MAGLMSNETKSVAAAAAADSIHEFYRFSGENCTINANLNAGMSSTQFYWSLANPYVLEFRENMELLESKPHKYTGYDGRAGLLSLASVHYYVIPAKTNSPVPYGFSYVGKEKGKKIYRNDYALPLAYTYDSYIEHEEWEKLTSVEKQEALLTSCVLEEKMDGFVKEVPVITSQNIEYKLKCKGDGILLKDNSFVVTSPNSTVNFEFQGIRDSETYLSIQGLYYEGIKEYDLYFGDERVEPLNFYSKADWDGLTGDKKKTILRKKFFEEDSKTADMTFESSTGVSRSMTYDTPEVTSYNNRHDFTVNFGYSEKEVSFITVKFKDIGIYTFDTLQVECQPMEGYGKRINARKADALKDVEMNTDIITGRISLDTPKLLCMSIPYAKGWRAYVDGKETEVLRANVQYMAIALDAGEHRVRLVYDTPLLKVGIFISVVSALFFVILIMVSKQKAVEQKINLSSQ